MDNWGSVPGRGSDGNFCLRSASKKNSGAHPVSFLMGTRAVIPTVKLQDRGTDHSTPSSAEVKNAWSYNSTPPIRFCGVMLC